jgi:hypothetical protein
MWLIIWPKEMTPDNRTSSIIITGPIILHLFQQKPAKTWGLPIGSTGMLR